jgi:hypothetical protein
MAEVEQHGFKMIEAIFDKLGGQKAVEKFLTNKYPQLSGGGMTPGGSVL